MVKKESNRTAQMIRGVGYENDCLLMIMREIAQPKHHFAVGILIQTG